MAAQDLTAPASAGDPLRLGPDFPAQEDRMLAEILLAKVRHPAANATEPIAPVVGTRWNEKEGADGTV